MQAEYYEESLIVEPDAGTKEEAVMIVLEDAAVA